MTEYQIEIGAQVQEDLVDIVRYIGQTLGEPRTVGQLYWLLKQEINSLNFMPERYPLEDEARCRGLGIRTLLVKNYKVLYLVNKERQIVQIARVIYAGRDITMQLEETDISIL